MPSLESKCDHDHNEYYIGYIDPDPALKSERSFVSFVIFKKGIKVKIIGYLLTILYRLKLLSYLKSYDIFIIMKNYARYML